MGLTIHYTLSTRQPLSDAAARDLIASSHAAALNSEADAVSRLFRVGPGFPLARPWVAVKRRWGGETLVDVAPLAGRVFLVTLGRDCEDLLLGLCRYPTTVRYRGENLPTKVGDGWRLQYFCKTQYAGLHGWDHFLRCHRTAIDLLASWRSLDMQVQIDDEGGYWPRRSTSALRRNLGEMNGIAAAVGGMLKDVADDQQTTFRVESPIFTHPQFERLEHEGRNRHAHSLQALCQRLSSSAKRRP